MAKDFYEDENINCYQAIRNAFLSSPVGTVFAKNDFVEYGPREAVRSALAKLVRVGVCNRAFPSVFYHRGLDAYGQEASPNVCDVAYAWARNKGWKIAPEPELAAAMFGLTKSCPKELVFLCTGHAHLRYESELGPVVFQFCEKQWFNKMNQECLPAVCAIMYMREIGFKKSNLEKVGFQLSERQIELLAKEMYFAPVWMQEYLEVVVSAVRAQRKQETAPKANYVDLDSELERALKESLRLSLRSKEQGFELQAEEMGL